MNDKKNKIELKRVSMNLPADLVEKVVEYGESKGLNTTSAYIVLLNQAFDYLNLLEITPTIMSIYQKEMLTDKENKGNDQFIF